MHSRTTRSLLTLVSTALTRVFAQRTAVLRLASPSLALLLGLFAVPQIAKADPVSVTYSAVQQKGNVWQYSYSVAATVSAGEDIAILFPFATSSSLQDLRTGGSDWTTFVYQPDTGIPADGEFDILANVADPSLASLFIASFLYSGTTAPGSQAFTLYDSDFNVLTTGRTVPAGLSTVPEPGTLVLLGSGLAGSAGLWRRRSFRR